MGKKDKKPDNQFKETKSHGEKRNGRLSQFKNHNAENEGEANEFLAKENH